MPDEPSGTVDATAVADPKGKEQETHTESFQETLLREAKEDGFIIGEPKVETPAEEPAAEVETETEPTGEEIQTEPTKEEEPGKEEPVKDEAAAEGKVPEEWPDSARKRVAEEAEKRRARTKELEKSVELNRQLDAENQRLQGELQQAQAASTIPRPNRADPLADIFTIGGLQQMASYYKEIIKLAELNPEGVYEIPVKQPDGTEKKMDFSREQLVEMKLDSEEMLRSGIPQREKYIEKRLAKDQETRTVYPEFDDPQSGWVNIGQQFLRTVPELQRDPDCWRWIARAIKGWQLEVEAAKKAKETPVNRVLASSQRKVAPVTPRSRGSVPRAAGSDLEKARKELAQRGNTENAEKFLDALWSSKKGPSKTALVR